jgi:hypothetical protein
MRGEHRLSGDPLEEMIIEGPLPGEGKKLYNGEHEAGFATDLDEITQVMAAALIQFDEVSAVGSSTGAIEITLWNHKRFTVKIEEVKKCH